MKLIKLDDGCYVDPCNIAAIEATKDRTPLIGAPEPAAVRVRLKESTGDWQTRVIDCASFQEAKEKAAAIALAAEADQPDSEARSLFLAALQASRSPDAAYKDALAVLRTLFEGSALQSICHHDGVDGMGRVKGTWGLKVEQDAREVLQRAKEKGL